MKKRKTGQSQFSQNEIQLIEQLRRHPEMLLRVQSILALALNAEGPLKTADQVEELLIEEIRKLGSATIHHWAAEAEERVCAELRQQDPTVLSRKKKR